MVTLLWCFLLLGRDHHQFFLVSRHLFVFDNFFFQSLEEINMRSEEFGCKLYCFGRLHAAIGPQLEGELVKIDVLTNAGVFDVIHYSGNRRKL